MVNRFNEIDNNDMMFSFKTSSVWFTRAVTAMLGARTSPRVSPSVVTRVIKERVWARIRATVTRVSVARTALNVRLITQREVSVTLISSL